MLIVKVRPNGNPHTRTHSFGFYPLDPPISPFDPASASLNGQRELVIKGNRCRRKISYIKGVKCVCILPHKVCVRKEITADWLAITSQIIEILRDTFGIEDEFGLPEPLVVDYPKDIYSED